MPMPFNSTYKQVVQNMQDIQKQLEKLNKLIEFSEKADTEFSGIKESIENINTSLSKLDDLSEYATIDEMAGIVKELEKKFIEIPEPGAENTGDIINSEDGTKVVGIHTNTTNVNNNTTIVTNNPDGSVTINYKQGVTYEIKNVNAIGLSGKYGMDGSYCMVATFVQDTAISSETNAEAIDFTPFQIAYSTNKVAFYRRPATPDKTGWEEWEAQIIESSGSGGSATLIVETDDNKEPAPQVQQVGEYWYERVESAYDPSGDTSLDSDYIFERIGEDDNTTPSKDESEIKQDRDKVPESGLIDGPTEDEDNDPTDDDP